MRRLLVGLAVLFAVACLSHPSFAAGERQAVYVNLADSLQGPFDDVSSALRAAWVADGWEVVAMSPLETTGERWSDVETRIVCKRSLA